MLHTHSHRLRLRPGRAQDHEGRPTGRRRATGRRRPSHLLAVVLLSLGLTAITTPATAASGGGEVAARWVERALATVRTGSPALHTGTPGAGRTYAMTLVAMYDAVNGIDVADGRSTRRAALVGTAGAPVGASAEAATSAAAHGVLRALFAPNGAAVSTLDAALAQELEALGNDAAVEAGRAWGAEVARKVLDARAGDGTQVAETRPGAAAPLSFPRPFAGAQFRHMDPFGIADPGAYASAGPPAPTSDRYAEDLAEVRDLGSSTDTDPERAAIARHWLAEGGTVRETGLWLKAALAVAREQGTVASLPDTVRLFALLGMGIADAVAVSWQDKYVHHLWRPGDAIRGAGSDGNPATVADETWNPRAGSCPAGTTCAAFGGTPEHTSGTSTFAGAAAAVLAGFYCTDRVPFTFAGEQAGAPLRSYGGFAEAAREAGRSRIYGGIHFQFSNEAGRDAGTSIGRELTRTALVDGTPRPACASR